MTAISNNENEHTPETHTQKNRSRANELWNGKDKIDKQKKLAR